MVLNRDLEIERDAPLVRIAAKGEQGNRTKGDSRRGRHVSGPGPRFSTSGPERAPPTTSLRRCSEKRAALAGVRSLPGEGAAGPPSSGQAAGGRTRTPPLRPFFGEKETQGL